MKIGTITEPNKKGQIVIPNEIRKTLGITQHTPLNIILRGGGIYIYPVKEVLSDFEMEESLIELLKKTQGAWSEDGWEKIEKRRRKIELEASKKRKKPW